MDPQSALKEFKSSKEFFVGIDSDGCVFPTMEIKHKQCFVPEFVRAYGLEPVAAVARETWEFVNLYSMDRGVNRFPALLKTLELLSAREEFKRSGLTQPDLGDIRAFVASSTPKSNSGLKEFLKERDTPSLQNLLTWSDAVNSSVNRTVNKVPPFPSALKSLEKLFERADIMVVSGTPAASLEKEWKENGLTRFVRLICGQEAGSKKEHLTSAAVGRYENGKILMIGDAPGDFKAAAAVGAQFYPIYPGAEEKSWEMFFREAADRFFNSSYSGEFQDKLIDGFFRLLPEKPGWR